MKPLVTIFFLLLFGATTNMMAQSAYQLLEKSTMQIEGTSTIHDWTANVEKFNTAINFNPTALESKSNPVESLVLTIPVDKIESGKGGMNKKIYGALKENKYPSITFELMNTEFAAPTANNSEASFQLIANGTLSIAGTSREISLPVDGYIQDNGSYKFMGSYEINMKDYNVDPPSAMLGTIKSGEMVTVSFELFIEKG